MARVLIPLAQGCEETEAVTVIDLLRRAGIEVVTAGLDDQPVRASRGVVLIPDTTLDSVLDEDFDMIALPGGAHGADNLRNDPRIIDLLKKMSSQRRYTAAICAAPKVFAEAGLLDGRRATSFPGALDGVSIKDLVYLEDSVVQDDRLVTSRGPGTAMDFALSLIELLVDVGKRDEVERGLVRAQR